MVVINRYPGGPANVVTNPWFRTGRQQAGIAQLNCFISDVVLGELNRGRVRAFPPEPQAAYRQRRSQLNWNGSASLRLQGRQHDKQQQFLLSNLQAQLAYEYYQQLESTAMATTAKPNWTSGQQRQHNRPNPADLLTPFLFVYVPLINNVSFPPLPTAMGSNHHMQQRQQQQQQLQAANNVFPTRLASVLCVSFCVVMCFCLHNMCSFFGFRTVQHPNRGRVDFGV